MHPSVKVDLGAIVRNYAFLCAKAQPAKAAAVVKADAYGLGAVPVAQALYGAGCRLFVVAYVSEAAVLRDALPDVEILALHGANDAAEREEAARVRLMPMLNDLEQIEAWRKLAGQKGRALPCMIHLDTGMNRLGLSAAEQARLAADRGLLAGLAVRGWASHFVRAEDFDDSLTREQKDKMVEIVAKLPAAPISICNSSGLFWGPDYAFDIVRPGLALYGGNPTPHAANPMQNVVTLQAPILQIRQAAAGDTVGYGATHRFARPSRIATVALGYADGYRRSFANKGVALIGGHEAPIVGRISMDLTTLDVTDVPEEALAVGGLATLIGAHRPIDVAAAEADTIAYEVLTSWGPRVERVYRR